MSAFLEIILEFPTIVYSILLGVVFLYWIIAAVGLVDIDAFDLDMDIDADMDVDSDVDVNAEGTEGLAGLLVTWGLTGVPLTVVVSLLVMVSWLLTYFASYFSFGLLGNNLMGYLIGAVVIMVSFAISIPVTAKVIVPLRPVFRKAYAVENIEKVLLGRAVKVRSSRVDENFGEAVFEEDGSPLILKVRSDKPLKRGDIARIIEFRETDKTYLVVSAEEFGEI